MCCVVLSNGQKIRVNRALFRNVPGAPLSEDETRFLVIKAASSATAGHWEEATRVYGLATLNGTGTHAVEAMYQLAVLQESTCGALIKEACPLERDLSSALTLFGHAARLGHPGGQLAMAVAMSSGALVLGSTEEVQILQGYIHNARNASFEDVAVLHEYFASLSHEPLALMALGWRHLHGHGVPVSCDAALEYYEVAADISITAIARAGVAKPNDRSKLTGEFGELLSRAQVDRAAGRYLQLVGTVARSGMNFAALKIDSLLRRVRLVRQPPEQSLDELGFQSKSSEESVRLAEGMGTTAPRDDLRPARGNRYDDHFWGIGGSPERGSDVIRYYRHAADRGDTQAEVTLGHFHYFGTHSVKQDLSEAAHLFERAANKGDTSAASWLGHMLARGLGVEKDEGTALKWLRIGVEAGEATALNALGLLELAGVEAKRRGEVLDDISEYVQDIQLKVQSQVEVAKVFSEASDHVSSDHVGMRAGAEVPLTANPRSLHLYTEIALTNDLDKASRHFRLASERGSADALYNLGMVQLGWDGREATEGGILDQFLENAADPSNDRESSDGSKRETSSPRRNSSSKDVQKALQCFRLAAQKGHLRAYHIVGKIYARGIDVSRSCDVAVGAFKLVAERGPWIVGLAEAHASFRAGDTTAARLTYARLAHAGYEVAQSNAAWLIGLLTVLSRGALIHQSPSKLERRRSYACGGLGLGACERRALALYRRAAKQGSADASLRIGDLYYYNRGLIIHQATHAEHFFHEPVHQINNGTQDLNYAPIHGLQRAVAYYQAAHDLRSARATFALAWCYHRGIGVEKPDFNLAKRHYELAIGTGTDALWPARLGLLLLQVEWSLSLWRSRFPLLCRFCHGLLVSSCQIQHTLRSCAGASLARDLVTTLLAHDIVGAICILSALIMLALARHRVLVNSAVE